MQSKKKILVLTALGIVILVGIVTANWDSRNQCLEDAGYYEAEQALEDSYVALLKECKGDVKAYKYVNKRYMKGKRDLKQWKMDLRIECVRAKEKAKANGGK